MSTENENVQLEEIDEIVISDDVMEAIQKKTEELLKTKGVKKVVPIAVEGDELDAKPLYVAYLKEPDFKTFSKFQALSANNQAQAMKQLANDCWLDGDRELIDDDSLFMFGLMPQLLSVVRVRRNRVLTFSKAGK